MLRRVLSDTRNAIRESRDMSRLLALERSQRDIVVYAEDSFTYVQLRGYLSALWNEHGRSYHYVTSDPDDPLFENPPDGGEVWYVNRQLPRLVAELECGVFLTTMPDLGQFHVPRPKSGRTVYAFHSLNSTHTAYRQGAFDHYDVFMCTGPHHVAELTRMRDSNPGELAEVGYYKLDLIRHEHSSRRDAESKSDRTALLAPSWGRANLLEAHGSRVVQALLDAGLNVVVRPHPQFFHSLYPEGSGVIDALRAEFGREPRVRFELTIDSHDSFHTSDLMVSDWSGAAFEYALGTLRPVLFIETPQKIFNDNWRDLGLPSFEDPMRQSVGRLVGVDEIDDVGTRALDLMEHHLEWSLALDKLAAEAVFNLGRSSSAGAAVIANTC